MPVVNKWYIPEQIGYIRFYGEVLEDELRKFMDDGERMIDSSSRANVHFIIDLTDLTRPVSLAASIKLARERTKHPRSGWSITVGKQSSFTKFIGDVTGQILNTRMRAFDTTQEALDFLRDMDETIDWSHAEDFERFQAALE